MQQDHWDHLFEDEPVAGDTQQVAQPQDINWGAYHGGKAMMPYTGSCFELHKVVATVPWKRQGGRSGHVRTSKACERCGARFMARRGTTCSKPCYQSMYRERMRNG